MAILEKLKFYYVVLYKKSGFLPFFFVFFGHFLSLFWTPLNRCTFLDLLCHFFWNLFWNGLFYVFIYLGVNKGQKRLIKWSKSGQKVVKKWSKSGVIWPPFGPPISETCLVWDQEVEKKGTQKVDQKWSKKWSKSGYLDILGPPFFSNCLIRTTKLIKRWSKNGPKKGSKMT